MQVILRVLNGKSEGKDIKIKKDEFLIGRHEDCHLRPKTDSVSRKHCSITIVGDKALCRDLGSKNGTYLNDEKVEGNVELQTGDMLRVGKMKFEIVVGVKDSSKSDSQRDDSSRVVLDGDITDWLEEADMKASQQRISDPDTRQFRLSDLETINSKKVADDKREDEKTAEERKKLAKIRPPSQDNSRDAAADVLKRYFNRT